MTLGGKSLFASTLLNSALVAVMAGVVLYPAPRVDGNPSASDDDGTGWSLVIDTPAEAASNEQAESALPAEPEIAPPTAEPIRLEVTQIAASLPPMPTADIVTTTNISALPVIAAPPARARIPATSTAAAKTGKKRSAQAGAGSESPGSGKSGNGAKTGLYTPAQYASTPRAPYPAAAKKAGISGTVILSVSIDESGQPTAVNKVKSSGNPELDEAAIRTVQRWRFHPAKIDDRAVATRLQIPVRFALK